MSAAADAAAGARPAGRARPPDVADAVALLDTLVAFDTTSSRSNRALVDFACAHAARFGGRARLTFDARGDKANALLSIGPDRPGGIVLSGHTDVVPADDREWTSDPFRLTRRDDRLHGRGTADMKAFIAAALAAMPRWRELPLAVPIHLALSFDEEVGCLGAPLLIDDLARHVGAPSFVWVGEPTGLRLATAHKGFCLFRTTFHGKEAHSSQPHAGTSAIAAAVRFAQHLLDTGTLLAWRRSRVIQELPRHTTFNLGLIEGGSAINVIPGHCALTWEFRPVPDDDAAAIRAQIDRFLASGLEREFGLATGSGIEHELLLSVPPLHADPQGVAVRQLAALLGCDDTTSVPFGSEAGLFAQAGWPAVVCGPGEIAQAHQPDEFVELAQLARCLELLDRLGEHACDELGAREEAAAA